MIGDRRLGRVVYAVVVPLGGITAAVLAPRHSSSVTRFMYGLGGLWLGWVAAALVVLAVIVFTPYKYSLHWFCDAKYRGKPQGYAASIVLELVSECDHVIHDLQCEIVVPGDVSLISSPRIRSTNTSTGVVGVGGVLEARYPIDFRRGTDVSGVALTDGTYKVRWTSLVHKGSKRVTIAKQSLVITPELLDPRP